MKVTGKTGQTSAHVESTKTAKSGVDALFENKKGEKSGDRSLAALGDSSRVDVSEKAQTIRRAKDLATPNDSIDEAKVARLQKMIDEGKYSVDASAIADKLVDEQFTMPS